MSFLSFRAKQPLEITDLAVNDDEEQVEEVPHPVVDQDTTLFDSYTVPCAGPGSTTLIFVNVPGSPFYLRYSSPGILAIRSTLTFRLQTIARYLRKPWQSTGDSKVMGAQH